MDYIYAALSLHAAKQPISEESVKKVLTASGATVDDMRVKSLVAALQGVNIDEAIAQAAVSAAAAAPAAAAGAKEEKKPAADEKSEADREAEAASGLASLFG
jgi:large subunit ribosomal protein L12